MPPNTTLIEVDQHRSRHALRALPAALVLAAAGFLPVYSVAAAQAIDIQVLNAQYTTELTEKRKVCVPSCNWIPIQQTTTVSNSPLGLQVLGTDGVVAGSHRVYAKANADTLSVSAATAALPFPDDAGGPWTQATAKTMFSFSTFEDASGPVIFDFLAGGSTPEFSDGFVSLYDLTAGQSMFYSSWNKPTFYTFFDYTGQGVWRGSLLLEPTLLASHVYSLTMDVSTNANYDRQAVSIQLSGLQPITAPIPEPSTYALMLAGLAAVAVMARRRKAAAISG